MIFKYKGFLAEAYIQGDGFRLTHQHGDTFPEPTTTKNSREAARWIEQFNAAADAKKLEMAERENALRLLGFEGSL